MTTKAAKSVKKPLPVPDNNAIAHATKMAVLPSANAAAVIDSYANPTFGKQNANALVKELDTKITEVGNGDLRHCEAMLVGQAHALQSIFISLARRAANQDYLKQYETYLRLALRAQNQSRMTLETLATLKNPPVVFAKQANINHGNQQVNNGITANTDNETNTHAPAHAQGKIVNQSNELLEVQHGERLDSGTTSKASDDHSQLETVGTINRR